MEAAHRLETEDDPLEIARAQGKIEQLRRLLVMEDEIEKLDIYLIKAEEYAAMKDANSKKATA
jgi:hypothetical protein